MTIVNNTCDGGNSGETVSVGNSGGGGTAFDFAVRGGSNELAYANYGYHSSPRDIEIYTPTSGVSYVGWSSAIGSQTEIWLRGYFNFSTNPSARIYFCSISNGSSETVFAALETDGKLTLRYPASTALGTTTNSIALGHMVRVEIHLVRSATVGVAELRLYNDPNSDTYTEQVSCTSINTGSHDSTLYNFGNMQTSAGALFWVDDIGVSTTSWMGQYATYSYEKTGYAEGDLQGSGSEGHGKTYTCAGTAEGELVSGTGIQVYRIIEAGGFRLTEDGQYRRTEQNILGTSNWQLIHAKSGTAESDLQGSGLHAGMFSKSGFAEAILNGSGKKTNTIYPKVASVIGALTGNAQGKSFNFDRGGMVEGELTGSGIRNYSLIKSGYAEFAGVGSGWWGLTQGPIPLGLAELIEVFTADTALEESNPLCPILMDVDNYKVSVE
jgi:hypothetical protein